jgi:ribosome-binding protein aMBF1 (putative translation factor)
MGNAPYWDGGGSGGGDRVTTRSYAEITNARRAQLTPEAQRQRAVFEQAYDIALQVIELREKQGLTQAELAARCGMDQADISRIERGSTSPTTRTLQRIANALAADVRLVERAS